MAKLGSCTFSLVSFAQPTAERDDKASSSRGLDYTKALYANVVDWYKDVHSRAQHVLTVDATFLTVLGAVLVTKASDLGANTATLSGVTKVLLAIMALLFITSIVAAVIALTPRRLRNDKVRGDYDKRRHEDQAAHRTPPTSVMWYALFIDRFGRDEFMRHSQEIGDREYQAALASQIVTLAERLGLKYRCVFVGYATAASGLVFMLLSAISYVSDQPPAPLAP